MMSAEVALPDELTQLYRAAVRCRVCVDRGWIQRPVIDSGQPRSVGPRYFASPRKVLIALINPGVGKDRTDASHQGFPALLSAFAGGEIGLEAVNQWLLADLPNWGTPRGRFTQYLAAIGLDPKDIAILNIALCANDGNNQPREMFAECFPRHTTRILQLLAPDVVLLMGSRVWGFGPQIASVLENAAIVPTFHFAQRGGPVPVAEIQWIRQILAQRSLTGLLHRPSFTHQGGNSVPHADDVAEKRVEAAGPAQPQGVAVMGGGAETSGQPVKPTKSGRKTVRQPFKPGSNGDIAWQHLLPKLIGHETITAQDIEAGFALVPDNPEAVLGTPAGRASQFPRFCIERGVLRPAGQGLWVRGPAFEDPQLNPEKL